MSGNGQKKIHIMRLQANTACLVGAVASTLLPLAQLATAIATA